MSNIKKFVLYSILLSVSTGIGIITILDCEIVIYREWMLILATIILLGVILVCISIINWLHNIVYYLYFKKRGYDFLSINIFPFLWIRDNKKKWNSCYLLSAMMELNTQVSYEQINTENKFEQYIKDHRLCIKNIFRIDCLLAVISFVLAIKFVRLGVFLIAIICATMVLNSVESTNNIKGGIWKIGMKEGTEASLFLKLVLEDFDKTFLYSCIQKTSVLKMETVDEKEFITGMLIDAISDNLKYMNEELEVYLERRFLYFYDNSIEEIALEYLRIIRLYYLYLKKQKSNSEIIQLYIEKNWEKFMKVWLPYKYGQKVIESVSKKEIYSINNNFDIYNAKVYEIYD